MSNVKEEKDTKSVKTTKRVSNSKNASATKAAKKASTTKTVKKTDSKSSKSSTKTDAKKSVNKSVKKNTVKKPRTKKVTDDSKSINKPMNVEEITLEEAESYYHVSLLVQAVCGIGILFISILAIFEHSFTVPIEVLVGVMLLIMAYNNVKLFKRKNFTVIYIIFGVVSLILGILGYFGVTL